MNNTIAAIATPVGEGGLSIIRFSGKDALKIAQKLFRTPIGNSANEFLSHKVYFGSIQDPVTEECIDEVTLTWFKAPKSYTGEDMVEISIHGGSAVIKKILPINAYTSSSVNFFIIRYEKNDWNKKHKNIQIE